MYLHGQSATLRYRIEQQYFDTSTESHLQQTLSDEELGQDEVIYYKSRSFSERQKAGL